MPLLENPSSVACEDYRVGIGFTMLNDHRGKVVVWVDKGALLVLSDRNPGLSYLTLVDQQRELLQAIASQNYDAGIVEPDGSTIIRREDVSGRR